METQENIVEVPAPVEEVETVEIEKPKKARKPRQASTKKITPKELAHQLSKGDRKVTPQKVRRTLRTLYGVQHAKWELGAKEINAVKAALKVK